MKHRNEDPDGKLTAILNNAQPPPPPRDSDKKVPIPRQYTAPLEKEQHTININLATAEDNNDTSNELEITHSDLEDQLEDQNEQVSQLIQALAALSDMHAAFLNVKCLYEYLACLMYLFA